MRVALLALLLALLLAGCASTGTPFSSPDLERARAGCLLANRLWVETREVFDCLPLPSGMERRETR